MKVKGKDLEFISRIKRDGSGTEPVSDLKHARKEEFNLNCLSISEGTFIAAGFNSYVVKRKSISEYSKKELDQCIDEKIKQISKKCGTSIAETKRQALIYGIRRITDVEFLEPYPGVSISKC